MTVRAAMASCGLRVVSMSEVKLRRWMASSCLGLVILAMASIAWAQGTEIGPAKGSLMLIGGGGPLDDILIKKVIELAGGPDELIVLVPTAGGAANYDETFRGLGQFRQAGAKNLRLLHTYDRAVADSDSFVEPLRGARGVFLFGGTNAILADAYLSTRTQRELVEVLSRGGVVAGTSAGAEIQGSFMPRGNSNDPNGDVLIGDHQIGLNLLHHVAVDAHVLVKNRQFDMLQITDLHPELLGIAIDEQTGIVVQQDQVEVIGRSYVLIYDNQRSIPPNGGFYFLKSGDRYNLRTREATRPAGLVQEPIGRVQRVAPGRCGRPR